MMKRRDFFKTAAAATTPVLLHGIPVAGMQNSKLLQLLADEDCADKVLVLIQLNGGNDGLNTIMPLDQYDKLARGRSNILVPENEVLSLNGVPDMGFHPRMGELQNLFNDGKISVIQNVGYPNQNFSHFRSTDIWLTASDSDVVLDTGWLGRALDCDHPDFPTDYPNAENPDPIGVQTGLFVSPAFLGPNSTFGHAIEDPEEFYQLITDEDNTPTDTPYGHELAFIRQTARQSNAYNQRIVEVAQNQDNLSSLYPTAGQNRLADQLKIVARMIGGGLKTKVYMVSLGGFDTHASQVDPNSTTSGAHADLLGMVSEAMNAFQDDIEKMNVSNRVLSMTFSEFGRRIGSNGSQGTDHGAAAPMMIMSSAVEGSIIGDNPVLPDNPTDRDNLEMDIDFRSVYATVLRDWFCLDEEKIKDILYGDFDLLPLKTTSINNYDSALARLSVFPNPARDFVYIEGRVNGNLKVEVFGASGKRISSQYIQSKEPLKSVDIRGLSKGMYHLRLSHNTGSRVVKILVE